MNTTISNHGLHGVPPATGGNKGSGSAAPNALPAGSGAAALTGHDQLQLTDSARALQRATRPDEASAIDPQRVEQVRQSLADGSYKVNAGNIADRMIAMDRQIGGRGKV